MSQQEPEPEARDIVFGAAALLRQWLSESREMILERPPSPEDATAVRRQLAALAAPRDGTGGRREKRRDDGGQRGTGAERRQGGDKASPVPLETALALWRLLHAAVERELDLFGDDPEAIAVLTEGIEGRGEELSAAGALELARGFLAPEGGCPLTPADFGARLQLEPPARLGLPDRVELAGTSLTAFLESAHFPFGWYRVGEERFFVTPSLRLDAATLEALARSGRGDRRVGPELLVWQPVSFRVAAGTAADAREARPFVGPSGARAYLWLGPVLPGGPLVIRDANNVETRIAVPEEMFRRSGVQAFRHSDPAPPERPNARTPERPNARTPERLTPPERLTRHPALERAEEALRRGEEIGRVERWLREVMRNPGASGEALAGAGTLWQTVGRPEVARAAFTMALERGSVEGALGLSRLAETTGEGLEAATRPLDAAIARNLRSAELHARYAELLGRLPAAWSRGPVGEWHRERAEELWSGRTEERHAGRGDEG